MENMVSSGDIVRLSSVGPMGGFYVNSLLTVLQILFFNMLRGRESSLGWTDGSPSSLSRNTESLKIFF